MLTAGTRVGPYEILDKLGEGGMGQVYRAADTKLGRDVALKILPASVAADPERLARFDREARTLASLNHPHIAHIYGVESFAGAVGGPQSALVMEMVDGEDLAQRIARGPVPLDEALAIARQIADALATAHEQRIVHRDLKPANIKIRPDGVVKVLDFGLAKAVETGSGTAAAIINAPTLTSPVAMTGAGTIVGTAAYMSPEQARGRSVDRRADVWAFGCVLYEMLTGRRPFDGTEVTDLLAAVIRDAPRFEALPPDVPASIRRLLRRCLEKDPAARLDSMRAARLELDERDGGIAETERKQRKNYAPLWIGAAGLAIPALVGLGYVLGRGRDRSSEPATRVEIGVDPAVSLGPLSPLFDRPSRPSFVLTSDGRRIVFAGVTGTTTQLYVRSLDAREATALAGTLGAQTPFLSPDNQWIGYLADGTIRKVPLAGGPVVSIADLKSLDRHTASPLVAPGTDFYGASWGEDGTIVFGRYGDGLWQVSAAGGRPSRLTTAGDGSHRLPHHLPGGRGLLLSVLGARDEIAVLPPGTTAPRMLIESATDGKYVAPSHIVFARGALLMGVRFDLERLTVTGTPFPLEQDIMVADGSGRPASNSGAAQFAVSRSGTLVFATGGPYPAEPSRLLWVDRTGRTEIIHESQGTFGRPKLSPDGRRIAVALHSPLPGQPGGIYIADLARKALTPLTRASEWSPVWSPDGADVIFMEGAAMGRARADGSAPIEHLRGELGYPHSVTPDGAAVLFGKTTTQNGSDVWLMPLTGDRTGRPVLQSSSNEAWAELSPDGKWLAYGSDSSGQFEVYVQPFPGPGPREQITFGGGDSPLWSRNGRELFFLVRGDVPGTVRLNAVEVNTSGTSFSASQPRVLFTGRYGRTGSPTAYDVSPDGQRFLMTEYLDPPKQPVTRLRVVLNWFEELRRAEGLSR